MIRTNHFCMKAKRLWSCERGSVAPLVGVCMIMLVGSVAVAVDIGRGQVAQSKLQSSLDAAGLAAGAIVGQTLTVELLKPEAEKYLDANFNGGTIDATITDFDLELSEDTSVVTLDARASLPTTFMRIFGKDTMNVAARTEITRETTGLEVALVLDITGSMNNAVGAGDPKDKIVALREAGNVLLDILFLGHDTVEDLWVGVVPFSLSVNIGASHADWLSDLSTYTTQNLCIGSTTSGTPKCPTSPAPLSNAKVSTRTNPVTLVDRYMFSSNPGWYFSGHSWRGCVLERWANNRDVTDDPPSVQKWQTFFAEDTSYSVPSGAYKNNWRGPTDSSGTANGNKLVALDRDGDSSVEELSANRGCPEYPVTPLTNVKATAKAAIDEMLWPNGYTHVNVGAVWGWRLLSPKWRGLWGGQMDSNNLPLDYDDPLSHKVMVLMTDGINTMASDSYTAYGLLSDGHLGTTSSESTAKATLNTKTKAICDAMKDEGIVIYSVVFGNESDTTSKNMMKYCASEADFYFFSPTTEELKKDFKEIADSLSRLRVSR